jgi:hypothetical protein
MAKRTKGTRTEISGGGLCPPTLSRSFKRDVVLDEDHVLSNFRSAGLEHFLQCLEPALSLPPKDLPAFETQLHGLMIELSQAEERRNPTRQDITDLRQEYETLSQRLEELNTKVLQLGIETGWDPLNARQDDLPNEPWRFFERGIALRNAMDEVLKSMRWQESKARSKGRARTYDDGAVISAIHDLLSAAVDPRVKMPANDRRDKPARATASNLTIALLDALRNEERHVTLETLQKRMRRWQKAP